MEDLLTEIANNSNNFPQIERAAREAVAFLGVQHGLLRDPPYELREKCLFVLQLCLETRRTKFTAMAVTGLQKIIRDDRFHTNIEPDDDSKWLPLQFLQATNSFLSLSGDTQVDILKILLNMVCCKKCTLNGRTLICILSFCGEAFEYGNSSIQSAAQAAASQTIRSFCLVLEEEYEETSDASNFSEIIPVMQYICSKICEAQSSSHCDLGVVFLLECILTICSSLPQIVCSNSHLRTFFWQKLCPVLISVLGTPKVDKNIITRNSTVEKEHGRGSGGLKKAPAFSNFHSKTVYSINLELVRLFGRSASLRPVLESVFHRVLLYPAPEHRIGALRAVAELFRNANRLLDMNGPMVQEVGDLPVSDLSLLRLIMDSVEESSNTNFSIMETSVMCCYGLLKAIEELCGGRCMPPEVAEMIIQLYPTLSDCDYMGPRTYESMKRLPKYYRETIEKETDGLKSSLECRICDSDSSSDTDGPEEEDDEDKDEEGEAIETSDLERVSSLCSGDVDRQRARHFVNALQELLPLLMPMRSSIQVDQALQCFASQYCEALLSEQACSYWNMIKADGIYVAVYSALLLDLRLFQTGYYTSPTKPITITEVDFVTEVKGFGMISYLTGAWLRELYQIIVASSLLQKHGYLPTNQNSQSHALINLITDVEGLGTCQTSGQMLWECRRLERPTPAYNDNVERDAGLRLSRQMLTCVWNSLLKVLAAPLAEKPFRSPREKLRDFNFLGKENHCRQIKQLVTISIEGLQILTRLCNNLGLQDRCGSILELLASASCVDHRDRKKTQLVRLQPNSDEFARLTPSHSLSLELLLGSGLELGSHCYDCWPHVFRCCIYVKKLEREYFSKFENQNFGSTTKVTKKEENSNLKNDSLSFESQSEEDSCIDVYSFLCSSEISQTVTELVSGATQQRSKDVLKPAETAKVICVLSQLVDKLFEDAALKLNLKSLESFSTTLCLCSHEQLFPNPYKTASNAKRHWWHRFLSNLETSDSTLLLDSVGEILLKSVRSGRPLFHVMRIWTIIVPHLKEVACHKDLTISRKAIKHIHDCINATLSVHSELPYFHITEALFKPFENLLCLELCEPDIQDQIVSCICEFVEANFIEIRSGWRPLFGSLRAVSTNINTLLDVFRVFLETDNVVVFSYAAVDYIMCLLKHLRVQSTCNSNTEIGFETLKYLNRCQSVLSSMYRMPHCMAFQSADHIQVSDGLLVDPVVMDFDVFNFDNVPDDLKMESKMVNSLMHDPLSSLECDPPLDAIDRSSGVLRVWFLLLEGIHSAAISANSAFQPFLLDTLYGDLRKLVDDPGPTFGLIVLNRLTLPMTQSWLRQLSKIQDGDFSGLKQSIGLLSDLILEYFNRLHSTKTCESLLNLLLNQVLLLLSECSIHPIPAVARIGPACIRHIIMSIGKLFTSEQWRYTTSALYRTCDMTLASLKQLMIPFSRDSQYYYGDSGQVKVAARHPTDEQDLYYTVQLSQRVFLLDEQREALDFHSFRNDLKIYTFLIQNPHEEIIRVPMKSLVVALQAHQSTLEIIADLLLQGTTHCLPSLANALNKSGNTVSNDMSGNDGSSNNSGSSSSSMPGLMEYLSFTDFQRLLISLDYSYHLAVAFDSRPGLKFLIQKVAGLERAANLYKQTVTAWIVELVSLFEYTLALTKRQNLTIDEIKSLLEQADVDSASHTAYPFVKLKRTLIDLCQTYVNVILNSYKDIGRHLEKTERPLFFLMASPEDDTANENGENILEEEEEEEGEREERKLERPFRLSDFSKLSESDSSVEENNDFDRENVPCTNVPGEKPETVVSDEEDNPRVRDAERENESFKSDDNLDEVTFIRDLLMEYKEKKKCYSEPHKIILKSSKEPPIPPEIEQQRRHSFLKDSEALVRVWTEMLGSVFQLLRELTDEEFQKLLPVYIDGVRQLMLHVTEPMLKEAVSQFFQRVSIVYGFEVMM